MSFAKVSYLVLAALAGAAVLTAAPQEARAGAVLDLPGCKTHTLPANDDDVTGDVDLGFPVYFGGQFYSSLHISNNGHVIFGPATPLWWQLRLWESFSIPLIAAFHADVDTRPPETSPVTYGEIVFDGRRTLCINWVNVGYYDDNLLGGNHLNSFQMLLVDRNNQGAGDFDVIFNYDSIAWESGGTGVDGRGGTIAPRAGIYNGSTVLWELPGSNAIGTLLDDGTAPLRSGTHESPELGRYKYELRGGVPPSTAVVAGTVLDTNGVAVRSALVSACADCLGFEGTCVHTATDAQGRYSLTGVLDEFVNDCGDWNLSVSPPAGSELLENARNLSFSGPGEVIAGMDVVLDYPEYIPSGTSITPSRGGGFGSVPVVYWAEPLTLTTTGCGSALGLPDPIATYSISQDGVEVRAGSMTETPRFSGTYVATVAPLSPVHGLVQVTMTLVCPDGSTGSSSFDLYIDPSGWVLDTRGRPLVGATVTLLRAETAAGPFQVVPDESAIMSPKNRNNPDYTDAAGHFGWDTIPGYYVVRAEYPGCVSPADPATTYVETPVLEVPPEWLDLHLYLDCEGITPPELTLPGDVQAAASSTAGAVVTYAATAHDGRDGDVPVTCSLPSGSQFPLGLTTVQCSAVDSSGNVAEGSFTVRVSYAWSDVLAPLRPDGENRFVAGMVVPVRFGLRGESAGIRGLQASLYVARVENGVPGPEQPARSLLGLMPHFVHEPITRQYLFLWATRGLARGDYQLRIDLGDGATHTVAVKLR